MDSTVCAVSLRDRIFERFEALVGAERRRRWFSSSALLSVERGAVTVAAASRFQADWLGRRFGDQIREAARRETGDEAIDVRFRVAPELCEPTGGASAERDGEGLRASSGCVSSALAVTSPAGASGGASLPCASLHAANGRGVEAGHHGASPPAPGSARPGAADPRGRGASARRVAARHRLEDFIVGPCSELAHKAALRLIEPVCPPGLSPLFIHGGCGLGKTHLLQGMATRFRETHPGARVRCTTGEAFTNGFIAAIRANKVDAFRRSHRDVELLCIDDVHFLSNKTATQAEFLHTFNALGLEGARVALASDEHPSSIRQFSKELASRFVAGMVVKLERPDQATRLAIARRIAARRGLVVEDAALAAVAARCTNSVREIEGALTKLDAVHRLAPGLADAGGAIGLATVRSALGAVGPARPARPVRVEAITECVCVELGVQVSDLMGAGRHKRVVLARSLTAYLARRLTTLSYPEIARAMGRPNHSSVVTACKRVEAQIARGEGCGGGPDLDTFTLEELAERLARLITRVAQAA